ncbi:hypothetical protein HDU67_003711 [Dinochytrium kinnereticum]|nr:hypothetical protein HDU67_003711 [Dinochytrium kinnereticum]
MEALQSLDSLHPSSPHRLCTPPSQTNSFTRTPNDEESDRWAKRVFDKGLGRRVPEPPKAGPRGGLPSLRRRNLRNVDGAPVGVGLTDLELDTVLPKPTLSHILLTESGTSR